MPLLASGDRPFFHVGSDLSQIVPLVRIAGFYPVDRSTVRIAGFTLSIVPKFGSRGFTLSIVLVLPLVRNGSHLHVVRRADVNSSLGYVLIDKIVGQFVTFFMSLQVFRLCFFGLLIFQYRLVRVFFFGLLIFAFFVWCCPA